MVDFTDDSMNYLTGLQQGARMKAMGGLDPEEKLDPEAAARALELSKATGADPALIRHDLPSFEQRNRNYLVDQILTNNPRLQDYVHSHPLAAEVSANDWHVLDSLDEKFSAFARATPSILGAAARGFKEHFDLDNFLNPDKINEKFADNRLLWSIYQGIAKPLYQLGIGLPTAVGAGALGGLHEGMVEGLVQMGFDENTARYHARQLTSMAEAELMRLRGGPYERMITPTEVSAERAKALEPVRAEIARNMPFVQAGVEPPWQGSKPLTEVKKLISKADSAAIEELLKESQKSETREAAPELFRDHFVAPMTEDARVGIDAPAALALYGPDEVPSPGDGKLGFIPGIAEQFERAKATGHDIDVPLENWTAEVPKEVAEALQDHVRPRAGAMTPDEIKTLGEREAAEPEEPPPPTLVDTLRESSGLTPLQTLARLARPALLPEGVIPEKTLIGQAVDARGYKTAAQATFPLKEGLARIKTHMLDELHGSITEFFKDRLVANVGDVNVHLLSREDFDAAAKHIYGPNTSAGGWYDHVTNEIVLPVDDMTDNTWASSTLLHEGAHALTFHVMFENEKLGNLVNDMRKEFISTLKKKGDEESLKFHDYFLSNKDEFMSGGYENHDFRELMATTSISPELAKRIGLEPTGTMWDAFRKLVSDILYFVFDRKLDNTMLDAFLKIQERFDRPSFEETFLDALPPGQRPKPGEPIPDYLLKAFKTGQALKMNNTRLRAYLEKVAEQHEGDVKFSKDQAILEAGKEATEDWKENLPRVKEESRKAIYSRPDIALDRYLRDGVYPNGSSGPKVKIGREFIPPEFRGKIPEEFLDKKGLHPDVLAEAFDLQSGRQVLEHLTRLEEQRQLEGLTSAAHLTQTIAAETQRRMTKDYGRTPEEILADAQDHIFKPTTHDILHDELAATYEILGQKPITKEAVKANAQKLFNLLSVDLHSSKKYTDEMHRQRTDAVDHLLADNPAESLKSQEKAALLAHHADFALKLEKQLKWLDKKVKTSWGRRDPPGIDQKHAVWIHDILAKVGIEPKRIEGDLERQKELSSPFKTLRDYVQHISDTASQDPDAMFPGQFPVAWWLTGDNFFQPLKEMTPPEVADVITSLKAIDAFARSERTGTKTREKAETTKVVSGLIDRLKAAVAEKEVSQRLPSKVGRTVGASLLNPESWAMRLDLGNAFGPFNQLIIRPIMEGLYDELDHQRAFAKLWKALPDIGRRERVENPNIFMDLDSKTRKPTKPIELDTVKLRAIIQNMGNAEQRRTLALGYGTTEEKIWDWLFNVVKITPEHFKFAQQMGAIYEKAFKLVEEADERRYGVAPERIPLGEIQTPWGMEKEWYHPKIPDSLRHSGALKAEDMMDQSGFYRPAPASGFKQKRTGAVYPIDLTFDQAPLKLKQILKYATMSEPVAEVSKIVLDPRFQTAFKRYYGEEYADGFRKWLKDVAGNEEWKPKGERQLETGLRFLQENMATAQIAFNLGTVIKHGPTALFFSIKENPAAFAKSAIEMIKGIPSGNRAWRETFDKSAEIRSRFRFMSENISATNQELFNKLEWNHKYFSMRDMIQLAGHFPVAVSDLLSSVTMWNGIYKKSLAEGMEEGEAVYTANTAVRRTHGSTIIGAKAEIMRPTNPMARSFLQFYNFFSVALQRNYQLGWMAKLAMEGRELPEMTGFEKEQYEKGFKHLPNILGGILVYGALVSLWEQIADPLERGEDEDPFLYWGKVLVRSYPAQIPYVREVFSGLYHGTTGTSGMTGAMIRSVTDELNPKLWFSNPGKILRKTNGALALFTGLTNEQFGKIEQYIVDALMDREDAPQGPTDVYNIYRHGTLKKQPRSMEELGEQITGVPRSQR